MRPASALRGPGELAQDTRQLGALLGIEAAEVGLRMFAAGNLDFVGQGASLGCQRDQDGASIHGVGTSGDQGLGFKVVNDLGRRARRYVQTLGDFLQPQPIRCRTVGGASCQGVQGTELVGGQFEGCQLI